MSQLWCGNKQFNKNQTKINFFRLYGDAGRCMRAVFSSYFYEKNDKTGKKSYFLSFNKNKHCQQK